MALQLLPLFLGINQPTLHLKRKNKFSQIYSNCLCNSKDTCISPCCHDLSAFLFSNLHPQKEKKHVYDCTDSTDQLRSIWLGETKAGEAPSQLGGSTTTWGQQDRQWLQWEASSRDGQQRSPAAKGSGNGAHQMGNKPLSQPWDMTRLQLLGKDSTHFTEPEAEEWVAAVVFDVVQDAITRFIYLSM